MVASPRAPSTFGDLERNLNTYFWMKRTLTLTGLVALGLAAQAQIAPYSVAPDFTANDINGVSHHLYEYLDQGYTVIMDVSAAWCGPCWNYHNSGALEDLYNTYGPGTPDNKVMVLFIEGESTNTGAQITGTSTGQTHADFSQGDWTAGTPYPIIDNATIANSYQISYFPTIYKICPNRIVREVGQLPVEALWAECQDCLGVAVTGNNAALITYTGNAQTCQDNTMNMPVKLQNRGTDAMTACDLEVRENGNTLATKHWTGNLASYAVATVNFIGVAFSNPENLQVVVTTPDNDASDDMLDPGITALPNASSDITFNLTLDYYCGETTWKLKNASNQTVQSGGPYDCASGGGGNDANTLQTFTWNLPNSCYSLEIDDAYGDGLYSDYDGTGTLANGSFELIDNSNGAVLWSGDPNVDLNQIYFSATKGGMKVTAVGIEENALGNSLSIFPNPTTGMVTINYSLTKASHVMIEVYNALGELVMNSNTNVPAGLQSKQMDLSDLTNGVYSMNIIANGMKTSRMISVTK